MQLIKKHPTQTARASGGRRGFTLIELMVATAIMVVLVGLVIQITGSVLNVWNRSAGRLSATSEARIALDLLTQDLQNSVLRNNGQQWLRVEAESDLEGPYDAQTVALKLFSPALDRPREDDNDKKIPGDISAIAYRLDFKESYDEGPQVYALYRAIEDPETTFGSEEKPDDRLLGTSSEEDKSPQRSLKDSPKFWEQDSITEDENYLAGNIVDFKVLIYEDDGTSDPDPVNADAQGVPNSLYAYGGILEDDDGDDVEADTNPILYADIILEVVSDQGMEILERMDENGGGTGYDDPDEVVREHGASFTRRVNIMGNPL